MNAEPIKCDLTVIGAGMAGMAATLFAVNRQLSIAQVGSTSEVGFASGFFDLMGIHPIGERRRWDDPWAGIETLVQDIPKHPYAFVKTAQIKAAFKELLVFFQDVGLSYYRNVNRNVNVITPLGTLKTTYCVPRTMWGGVKALAQKPSCLLVDIKGLKGFSARLIADKLRSDWPDLRTARISFPGASHKTEVLPEHMANALVISLNREKLAEVIRPHIEDAQSVGMPSILGLYQAQEVVSDLAQRIGVPLFEIPTMPPSVPGLRLKEAFERGLREKRPDYFSQKKVLEAKPSPAGGFEIKIGHKDKVQTVLSRGVILATGRFIGGGLSADRKNIRETIFDLPVCQPAKRSQWHREDLLDPLGHPINQAGLETDDRFRPLDKDGQPAFKTLFAAGSILAHQDWKRLKCGVGLAVATAYKAVNSLAEQLR